MVAVVSIEHFKCSFYVYVFYQNASWNKHTLNLDSEEMGAL